MSNVQVKDLRPADEQRSANKVSVSVLDQALDAVADSLIHDTFRCNMQNERLLLVEVDKAGGTATCSMKPFDDDLLLKVVNQVDLEKQIKLLTPSVFLVLIFFYRDDTYSLFRMRAPLDIGRVGAAPSPTVA